MPGTRTAVAAPATTIADPFGNGPVLVAMLIGYTGDIAHFANRDGYAS